jgi:hypothetical protein
MNMTAAPLLAPTAALALHASAFAPTPPAPLDVFQRTRTGKSLPDIEMALRIFCKQANCQLSRGGQAPSGSDHESHTYWVMRTHGIARLMVEAEQWPGQTYLSASTSRFCSLAAWPLSQASQLMAALNRAGIPVKPAHDGKCTGPAIPAEPTKQ